MSNSPAPPRPRLLVTRSLPARELARLEADTRVETLRGWELLSAGNDNSSTGGLGPGHALAAASAAAGGVDGLLVQLTDRVDARLLEAAVSGAAATRLRVVSTVSVGHDHVDLEACRAVRRRQQEQNAPLLRLGYTPDVLTPATAELTVALLLAVARRFKEAAAAVRDGSWGPWSPEWMCGPGLAGKTVGLVGYGRIGQAVADMVSAFGPARILYSTSRSPAGHTAVDGDSRPARVHVSLEDLLRHSDAVVLTCSLSDKTRHLIRAETLGLMPRGAMLINTARGGCVKQDDVLEALNSGHLAGVGLDVTDPEPLAPDHPLVLHPRCLVLPHVGSATVAAREAMARLAIDNAIAGLLGLDMPAELKF